MPKEEDDMEGGPKPNNPADPPDHLLEVKNRIYAVLPKKDGRWPARPGLLSLSQTKRYEDIFDVGTNFNLTFT